MTKVNIREALNQMDKDTDCKYDLVTLYESCNLTEEDKKDIAKSIADKEDADVIYDKLVDKYGDDLSFDDDDINDLKFLDMSKEAYLYGEDNHDFEDLESSDNSDVEESFGDDLIDSQYLDDTSDGHWSWDYDDDELANIYGGDTRYDYHPDGIEESQSLAEYWYFTRHGVQPGSIPNNIDVLEIKDTPNGTYFKGNRVLTTKELQDYEIKEKSPEMKESITPEYKMVEYDYDGDDISNYLGHVRVRTNLDKVALRAAEKYAMSKHPEDNPGHFKIVDDNYTNVDVIDSDGDYLTTLESVDESKSIKESSSGPKYVTRDIINKTNSQKLKDAYDKGELEVLINGDIWYTERCPKGLGKELKAEMKRLYPDIRHLYGESVDSELVTRKQNYLKAKKDFETLGEKDNNDVLSRKEKMLIAKAEYEKVLGHPIDESLNEDTQLKLFDDDMINDIDILYQWQPEEVEKILVKHGANPNNNTWVTGLDLPAAYDEIMSTFKDKYSDYDEIDYGVAKVLGLVDESLKEESSNNGWVKRWNFLDKYYKGDLVISKISSPVDAWHIEKVDPNGHTIKHLGNYKSLESAIAAADKLLMKNKSKSIKESNYNTGHRNAYIDDSTEKYLIKQAQKVSNDRISDAWISDQSVKSKGTRILLNIPIAKDIDRAHATEAEAHARKIYDTNDVWWDDFVLQVDVTDWFEGNDKGESLKESSYGGAFDIEDNQYFTRDDLVEFAEDVVARLNDISYSRFDYTEVYLEPENNLALTLVWSDYEYTIKEHIDMRKIRKPYDLCRVYAPSFVFKAREVFSEYGADFGPHLSDQDYPMRTESIENIPIEDIDKFVAEVKERFPGSEVIYDGDTNTIKITLDNVQKENLTEDSTESDELETADQKISSANTSINSSKLPAIFRLVKFEPDTLNLDYGGGKFDNAAEYLAQQNVTNLVYDPYNRSTQHNAEVLQKVRENGGADTITISNVLNVIAEPEARLTVLRNAKKLVKPGGNVYITVYEGNKSGEGTETKSGYQLNKSTADYIDEIASVFSTVNRRGKLIIAS